MAKTRINKDEKLLPAETLNLSLNGDLSFNQPVPKGYQNLDRPKVGHPTKYSPELCNELLRLMTEGKKDCQIFAEWNISRQTFYKWLREIPEFTEAHDRGLELAEKAWEDKGIRMMLEGDNKAFNFWIAFMNRKFGWSRTGGSDSTNININNMNVLNTKSVEDLQELILNKMNVLEIIPQEIDDRQDQEEPQIKDEDGTYPNSPSS